MTTITQPNSQVEAPSSSPSIAARAIDVSRVYGSGDLEVVALDRVNLDLEAASFTAIMGPSGSGKSTLMQTMAGLDRPTAGSIQIGGVALETLGERALTKFRRDNIGFVFQSFNLIPQLTAIENIRLPLTLARRSGDAAWIDHVVETVGLSERLGHRPGEMSGGQQQRVAVARALASRPTIVMADEPTGNLDSNAAADVLGLLRRATREDGQTIAMVTHDPVAASYADRAVFVSDGQVVADVASPDVDAVLATMRSMEA